MGMRGIDPLVYSVVPNFGQRRDVRKRLHVRIEERDVADIAVTESHAIAVGIA